MPHTTIFCQVGFGYKESPQDIYFHARDGEAVGFELSIPDIDEYLDPFSIEDLVAGKIDMDLLPKDLVDTIKDIASRTFTLIQAENPTEGIKLNPTDAEALFYEQVKSQMLN